MYLRYLNISLHETVDDVHYRLWFEYHTRFISNYLSRGIRKYRFTTDGSFNMINIVAGSLDNPKIEMNHVLEVYLPFDKNRYNVIKGTADYSYYIELFRAGIVKANEFKRVPLIELNSLIDQLVDNHFLHSWVHLKKTLHAHKLRVELVARFTTNDYSVTATFYDIRNGEQLCSGILIRTLPDEIFFSRTIKDVVEDSQKVFFLDYNLNNLIEMNVEDIRAKHFKFTFCDCAFQDDENAIETHNEIIRFLSYDG